MEPVRAARRQGALDHEQEGTFGGIEPDAEAVWGAYIGEHHLISAATGRAGEKREGERGGASEHELHLGSGTFGTW